MRNNEYLIYPPLNLMFCTFTSKFTAQKPHSSRMKVFMMRYEFLLETYKRIINLVEKEPGQPYAIVDYMYQD